MKDGFSKYPISFSAVLNTENIYVRSIPTKYFNHVWSINIVCLYNSKNEIKTFNIALGATKRETRYTAQDEPVPDIIIARETTPETTAQEENAPAIIGNNADQSTEYNSNALQINAQDKNVVARVNNIHVNIDNVNVRKTQRRVWGSV